MKDYLTMRDGSLIHMLPYIGDEIAGRLDDRSERVRGKDMAEVSTAEKRRRLIGWESMVHSLEDRQPIMLNLHLATMDDDVR